MVFKSVEGPIVVYCLLVYINLTLNLQFFKLFLVIQVVGGAGVSLLLIASLQYFLNPSMLYDIKRNA